MNLADYKRLIDHDEREWLDRLEVHAQDTGKSLETVLAEALIDRHRAALENAEAYSSATETVAKLRRELRDSR